MSGYVADTSIFVAGEHGRPLGAPPEGDGRISVATLTELQVGALIASGPVRLVREATLREARRYVALPYDEAVGDRLAAFRAEAKLKARRIGLMDAIIASTALVHDLTVWTQDDDFEALQEFAPELRVHRGDE